MSTHRRRTLRRATSDEGFGLVETVVAMLILSVVALAVLAMLGTAQRTAFGNRARVVAADLAASEMDLLRSQARDGLSALPVGPGRTSSTTVGGVDYEVRSAIAYVSTAAPGTLCGTPAGVQALNAVRVNVSVTWPAMGQVPPVTSDTVIAPSLSDTTSTVGTVVVRTTDRDGDPLPDAVVLVGARSATTTAEGCAIFTGVTAGPATLKISKPGHIGTDGTAVVTEPLSVVAGAATNVEKSLDRPATVTLTGPAQAAGWPVPTTAGSHKLRLANSEAPGGGPTVARTGATDSSTSTVVAGLFPYSAGYAAFAGPCARLGASGAGATAVTEPGGSSTVAVPFKAVDVVATRAGSSVTTGQMWVRYTSVAAEGCSPVVYERGSDASPAQVSADGRLRVRASLATGTYDVTVRHRVGTGSWVTGTIPGVVVDAGAPGTQTVAVVLP